MPAIPRRILWIDDEVELFEPHLLFLRQRGYEVDTTTNGDDALELARTQSYDLVLLDEQMPGRRGLDVLGELRREEPHARVVMVTKSEEDRTMVEAIGRRVDDYLVKPASPRQVLSVVTRLLEGQQIRQQRAAQDFAARFGQLSRMRAEAESWEHYFAVYDELVDWDLRLNQAGEQGLADTVQSLLGELRRDFGDHVASTYGGWLSLAGAGPSASGTTSRPPLSIDVVSRAVLPNLEQGRPLLFVIIDCMRLDQWRTIRPLLGRDFDIEESLYSSILPTATPYSRNAIFSGQFPDEIAAARPEWWEIEEGSLNAFEDELLREQLHRLTGRDVPVHYEKVFTEADGDDLVARVRGALRGEGVVAVVFNFVDMLTHGRSESAILMEVARDVEALRSLTKQWFERSSAARVLQEAAAARATTVLTTDHGSIHCHRPVTVFARRDATANLRYKFGQDLRAEERDAVYSVNDEKALRFPPGRLATNYLFALEDHFFVYPTKLREYQARYRGSFLHGGISPEEMVLPLAVLTPRTGQR
ncbi:MAG TPA: bifunctional response regulator/alkaline phosphatase family protein [Longimicrobiales bacterium]|nr:bifunctional response regulator/alkaline phosphatase family protein [Longimicrobiales bacterium]